MPMALEESRELRLSKISDSLYGSSLSVVESNLEEIRSEESRIADAFGW